VARRFGICSYDLAPGLHLPLAALPDRTHLRATLPNMDGLGSRKAIKS
jgi:hypothetical protein